MYGHRVFFYTTPKPSIEERISSRHLHGAFWAEGCRLRFGLNSWKLFKP